MSQITTAFLEGYSAGKKRHTLFLLYVNLIQTEMQRLLEDHDTAQNEICTTPP